MFNRQSLPTPSIGGTIIIAWIFFTSVYFFLSVGYPFVIGKTQNVALQNAQQQGYNAAVNQGLQTYSGVLQLGFGNAVLSVATALQEQLAGGCKEAVPITIGTGTIGILSTACIAQAQATSAEATPPTDPAKN